MTPDPMDPVAFRQRIERKRIRLTQRALSGHLHQMGVCISRSVIANWETARGTIPAWLVPFLARSLGVQVAALLPDGLAWCGVFPRMRPGFTVNACRAESLLLRINETTPTTPKHS